MDLLGFQKKKSSGEKLTMVTCYDHCFSRIIAKTSLDAVLVGDSLSMVLYGEETTLPATITLMARHVKAVKKGLGFKKPIIVDMPFLSYRQSFDTNIGSVQELMAAGGCAVKIEGVKGNEKLISHLNESGVPVMGHIGLTPQFVHQMGGFKVQGKSKKQAEILMKEALVLEDLGCFSIVLEAVPSSLARQITEKISIPTIGIGAGPDTDGQILVLHDLLGLNKDFKPKYLRTFLDGESLVHEALESYVQAVQQCEFPNISESYE